MSKRDPEFLKRYEELMRGAGDRRRSILLRNLELERLNRAKRRRSKSFRSAPDIQSLLHATAVLDAELMKLKANLAACVDQEERIAIKAEIRHFEATIRSLRSRRRPRNDTIDTRHRASTQAAEYDVDHIRVIAALDGSRRAILEQIVKVTKPKRRRPPEGGLPVPAVPPKGPLPKQGGAEAPLDFSE